MCGVATLQAAYGSGQRARGGTWERTPAVAALRFGIASEDEDRVGGFYLVQIIQVTRLKRPPSRSRLKQPSIDCVVVS